jgi:hypothetical protein
MSDSKGSGQDWQPHPLVQRLQPDASSPPTPATVLQGYAGHAPGEGLWLLWLSLTFDRAVQGRTDDLLGTEVSEDDVTTVWVRPDAALTYTTSQPVEASFVGGPLGGGAPASWGAGPGTWTGPARIPSGIQPCFTDSCTDFGPRCTRLRSDCLPCGTDFGPRCTRLRTDCLPCGTDTPTDCIPCGTTTRTDCLPCGTTTRTECLPCGTNTRTDCLPCGTTTRTDCLPCGTNTRTDCLPCPSDLAVRCPTTISPHCPTNVIHCPRTDEPAGCV